MSRIRHEHENNIYRVYTTNALKLIAENTAKFARGDYPTANYYDIIRPSKGSNMTADEIIEHIRKKLRGENEPL